MYSAHVLAEVARKHLLENIKPTYSRVYAYHVTIEFGIPKDSPVPEKADVRITGYIDSGDGIEALLVTVNGEKFRPDGKRYHITLSLDPNSDYSPKHSNDLIENADEKLIVKFTSPILPTIPKLLN